MQLKCLAWLKEVLEGVFMTNWEVWIQPGLRHWLFAALIQFLLCFNVLILKIYTVHKTPPQIIKNSYNIIKADA